eukprot:2638898-Pyramimonas_sp.AAC.1
MQPPRNECDQSVQLSRVQRSPVQSTFFEFSGKPREKQIRATPEKKKQPPSASRQRAPPPSATAQVQRA